MAQRMVTLLFCLMCLGTALPGGAHAGTVPPSKTPPTPATTGTPAPAAPRTLHASIRRITTAVATLDQVEVRLQWPEAAPQGRLSIRARRVDAADLGYHFERLHWQCDLRHPGAGEWRCAGPLQGAGGKPLQLAVDLTPASTDASLRRGDAGLVLQRLAAAPDDTRLDLTRVPLAWAQALLARAWPSGQLKAGTLDGRLTVQAPHGGPLQVSGPLALAGAGFDTPDATVAGEGLAGRFDLDYRKTPGRSRVRVDGTLRGGELLVGNAYVALPATPVTVRVAGEQVGDAGWRLPTIEWRDGDVLTAHGSAGYSADAQLQSLDLQLHSGDVAPLGARYLSGWLGLFGLADLQMRGALDATIHMADGHLQAADADLHAIDLVDPEGRFRFDGLSGHPRFSATTPVAGELSWRSGQLYGLDFDAASLPVQSSDGELRLREAVTVPAFGGRLRFDNLVLQPPAGEAGLRMRFGLGVDRLDIGAIAKALRLPAFEGELSGTIPDAHYADQRLVFDGGLAMQLFDGEVRVSALSLERPFGVAPSLSADLLLQDLDLEALTSVFGFGSITGRLDGRISNLRLVDWTATAFDAELQTDAAQARRRGVRQRISQRAVQNISSVGDASFVNSLQGRLIGFFDDFGYRRIGIRCKLANTVCVMGGLHPAPPAGRLQFGSAPVESGSRSGFTIVEGAGLPRLTVVGFNRLVDWPTLLERLAAVGKGEVKPIVQ